MQTWINKQLLVPAMIMSFSLIMAYPVAAHPPVPFGNPASSTTVLVWGDNQYGETNVPAGLTNVTAISGGRGHMVALKNDGTVVAWARNDQGQANVPAGLTNVAAIVAGGYNTLALKSDGTLAAWGGIVYQSSIPASASSNVVGIAAGDSLSIALKRDGTVVAWGENDNGDADVPAGLTNVTAIAAAGAHVLALKNDGTIVAWGEYDHGESTVPAGLTNVTAIAAGYFFSMAVKSDGTVVAWGRNDYGQTNIPAGLTNVTLVAGYDFGVALKIDSTVVAWGNNSDGQTNTPDGLTNVTAIGAADYDSMAIVGTAGQQQPSLTNIVVSSANLIISAGSNQQFTATGYFNDGSSQTLTNGSGGTNLLWTSSVPTVASITTSGLATGLTNGTTIIMATSGGISNSTSLSVVVQPVISVQPTNNIVSPNGSVTLTVSATGGSLGYQWQFNGTNISGATGPSFTITNVTAATIGVYTVVINNAAGTVTSQAAIVGTTALQMFAGIIVNGPLGTNYVIQSEASLNSGWINRTNLALPSQPYIYIDYSSPTNPQQFYQAMPQ